MNYQHVPQYILIKNYLLKLAQEKQPNTKLPSENELASMFSVSRGTAKQAVNDLVYEGVLYRQQGKGTFVSERRIIRSFSKLPSFTEDIRQMGTNPHTTIIKFGPELATPFLINLFGLTGPCSVIRIKRLVSSECRPVVLLSSYLNPKIYPGFTTEDMGESLYASLQKKYGIVPIKARDTYSITEVSPQTAEYLACKKNSCVCFSQRIGYLENDTPAEYVESFIRYDRFKLDISIGFNNDPQDSPFTNKNNEQAGSLYDVGIRNIVI